MKCDGVKWKDELKWWSRLAVIMMRLKKQNSVIWETRVMHHKTVVCGFLMV